MTLATDIVIADPIDPEKVHAFVNDLLGAPADVRTTRGRRGEAPFEGSTYRLPDSQISNAPGQGLPAWLITHYADDGPMRYEDDEQIAENEREGWQSAPHNVHCVRVDLDTAYGYKGPNGAGCSDLHAWLVSQIGAWLDGQGLRWSWRNEFTGEWFVGFDGLTEFGDPIRGALR